MTPDGRLREWTNWICPSCGEDHGFFAEKWPCCGKRPVRAYTDLRCPFCTDLPGWTLCTDGTTRPCACAAYSLDPHSPVPQPDRVNGISATVLAAVCNGLFPGAFTVPATANPKGSR